MPASRTTRTLLALALVLVACSGPSTGAGTGRGPMSPTSTENPMAKDDDGTTSVVDGKKLSFGEFQTRLGELSVDPTPTYTANLEDEDGGFGGTEELYVARSKANGDVYDYLIVRTPGHQHYELTRQQRGSGDTSAPASPNPAMISDWTLDGRTVDQHTFERTFRTLVVDAEPWVNAHMMDREGSSGVSATFEARDRKTGERWTYSVRSIGRHSSRVLSRGSTKPSSPARQ